MQLEQILRRFFADGWKAIPADRSADKERSMKARYVHDYFVSEVITTKIVQETRISDSDTRLTHLDRKIYHRSFIGAADKEVTGHRL